MSFADAKWPDKPFCGELTPHGAVCKGPRGSTGLSGAFPLLILSSCMITNQIWHCAVCLHIDTLLPVLQAHRPQVSGTKCHLLRLGWQSPRNADAPSGAWWCRPASTLTAFLLLSRRNTSQRQNIAQTVTQAMAKGSCPTEITTGKKWCALATR